MSWHGGRGGHSKYATVIKTGVVLADALVLPSDDEEPEDDNNASFSSEELQAVPIVGGGVVMVSKPRIKPSYAANKPTSCQGCHLSKVKCIAGEDLTCKRCARLRLRCLFQGSEAKPAHDANLGGLMCPRGWKAQERPQTAHTAWASASGNTTSLDVDASTDSSVRSGTTWQQGACSNCSEPHSSSESHGADPLTTLPMPLDKPSGFGEAAGMGRKRGLPETSGLGQSLESKAIAKPKSNKSCTNCLDAKTKCVPGEGHDGCNRCRRFMLPCVFLECRRGRQNSARDVARLGPAVLALLQGSHSRTKTGHIARTVLTTTPAL